MSELDEEKKIRLSLQVRVTEGGVRGVATKDYIHNTFKSVSTETRFQFEA